MFHRIQESDGGFFENLGTLLAEKARAQEVAEGPLPSISNNAEEESFSEDVVSETESIEEPNEALLESDSDRDENEHATDLVVGSVGWNVSTLIYLFTLSTIRSASSCDSSVINALH